MLNNINIYNDFDKLNSIILGMPYFIGELDKNISYTNDIKLRYKYRDELIEDRYNLSKTLKSLGVEVIDIPDYNIDDVNRINEQSKKEKLEGTFNMDRFRCTGFMSSPRDSLFSYCDTLIEHSVDLFKIFHYTQHAKDIYKEIDCRFLSMPEDENSKLKFCNPMDNFRYKPEEFFNNHPIMNHTFKKSRIAKIQIDAANILKLGKDLFINIPRITNFLGYKWLKEQFKDYDIRWHPIAVCNKHIDGTFVPLRPGLLLTHSGWKKNIDDIMPYFKKWDKVYFESTDIDFLSLDNSKEYHFGTTDINILSIDRNTIIVRQENYEQMKNLLKNYNFEIIPVSLRNENLWDGSLHCITCDINRDSILEDYFE